MIIKNPAPRGNAAQLADYLLHEKKNDRAELLEMRGWNMPTLKGAFNMTEEIAHSKTRCENPFYHVSFRAAPGEVLTPEQWQICADRLEKKLGLDGHHRALVLHTYKGENHLHVVWDRIDAQTLIAANLWQDHTKSNEVARQLERELGLKQVPEKSHDLEQEPDPPTMAEEQQARRKGQDLKDLRQSIRDAWQQSDSGKSFKAALEEKGFTLAQGDRRDYVALDTQGSVYSIGKRTTGASAAQVRERLKDLDRENIPTVEQARDELAAQKLAKELEQQQEQERLELEKQQEKERLELEQQQEQKQQEEAQAHDREIIKEAWTKTQTASAFAKALSDKGFILAAAHQDTFVAINPAGNCYSLDRDSTGAEAPAIHSRMGYGIHYEKMQLPTIEQARARLAERRPPQDPAHDREQDAQERPTGAPREPHGQEWRHYAKERLGQTQDQEKGKEWRRYAKERLGQTQDQEKGKEWRRYAKERLGQTQEGQRREETSADREISLDPGLKVLNRVTGISSSLKGVAGGIFRLLTTGSSQPPEPTPEERRANLVALRNIRDSLERGQDLDLADVQSLSPTHLKRIMEQGDEYLKNLALDQERRRREGRERER